MLPELCSWWAEQMRDLIAPLLNRLSTPVPDALTLECDPGAAGTWHVARRRRGELTPIADLPAEATGEDWRQAFSARRRGEPVVIALSQPLLLRQATFPIAAAPHLNRLLRYEIDRLTPFAAEDVLFTHRVRSRDTKIGTLTVDIALAPRTWVRESLDRLDALSIRPVALEAPGALPASAQAKETGAPAKETGAPARETGAAPGSGSELRRIALDHDEPSGLARSRFVRRLATGACAVLAAVAVAVPFVRQSLALAEVEDRIASLRPRMEQVDALRRRIASGSAGAGQIAAAREHGAAALRTIGLLTDLLPDDTYLTSLSLRHDRLTMEGRSAAATRLIASLAADPHLKNPAFAAPVVRGDNGRDQFTIQAGIGP
jgi:general secretion pathway protein L